jgi:cytochrome c biogenesis protein CcmG/thiol:disulfide interchange protein DsbE
VYLNTIMNKLDTSQLLWILVPATVILISTVAIIDRVVHTNAVAVSQATVTKAAMQNDVKVGNKIGFTAPDFTLPTVDGREMSLSDYRGRPVILNFWATWCGPCRYEVPAFKAFYERYPEEEVVIIAVSTQDDPDSARGYAIRDGLKFVIPVDPRGIVAGLYNVRGLPTTYIIDENGVIKSIKIGPFLSIDEMEERMTSIK